MKNKFFICIIGVLVFISCDNNSDFPIDRNYPTTIFKLSDTEYSKALADFTHKNKYVYSSLDSFGFCELGNRKVSTPSVKSISKEQAIKAIHEFIDKNRKETGVAVGQEVFISVITERYNLKDGQLFSAVIENPTINNIEVLFSPIVFQLKHGEVVSCYGHHYNNIYIPSTFNVDAEKAKSLLVNYELGHADISGKTHPFKITTDDLKNTITELKIYPLKEPDKIELRVVWQIYIPAVNFIVYVDVMTGEKVLATPTIIS